jgi:hypothetical protein
MQSGRYSVRPQELVNVELSFGLMVFVSYLVFNHEHLESRESIRVQSKPQATPRNLTDICGFEHLFVIQGLLRFGYAWQIDKSSGVGRVPDVKDTTPRVWHHTRV